MTKERQKLLRKIVIYGMGIAGLVMLSFTLYKWVKGREIDYFSDILSISVILMMFFSAITWGAKDEEDKFVQNDELGQLIIAKSAKISYFVLQESEGIRMGRRGWAWTIIGVIVGLAAVGFVFRYEQWTEEFVAKDFRQWDEEVIAGRGEAKIVQLFVEGVIAQHASWRSGFSVVHQDGKLHTWGSILMRETVGKFLSMLLLGIGYLLVAFDPQKRALHDRIAKTYVVKAGE